MFARKHLRVVALASALAVAGGLLPFSSPAQAGSSAFSPTAEAKKMDAVPTPKLGWFSCYQTAECTTVKVPRDYDQPKGAKVELALLRIKARNPKKRIGSLFVNPGGPGGSSAQLAYFANQIFSQGVLDRFDIVGMDPRGIGFSQKVQCFPSIREQDPVLAGYNVAFPFTAAQERAWLRSDRGEGAACSKNTLAKSMSTAEVARDMELMRRAVGDSKLSYLGFSYGTYLGQVYANMFPNRFRAVAVDGVLDPVAWAGSPANQSQPLEQRLGSAAGAWRALREILRRCDRAGGTGCTFAVGNPVVTLDLIADRLKKTPLKFTDDFSGETFTFGYPDLVLNMLYMLYDPSGSLYLIDMLTQLVLLTEPPAAAAQQLSAQQRAARADDKATARKRFLEIHRRYADAMSKPRFGFDYYNGTDAFYSVTCTDSKETTKASDYPGYAARADVRAPYFGRAWMWSSSACAGDAFTGNDEDAFSGPFNARTAKPVLIVGNYYDPATSYQQAVSAAARQPNSRLLSSDSWGHTAYGSSNCVTSAMDSYLISGKLPAKGKVCRGDIQPFDLGAQQSAPDTLQTVLSQKMPSEGGFR